MKLKLYVGTAIMSLFLMGCSESEDVSSSNCVDEISRLTEIYSQKTSTWAANQSVSNCNAMVNAGLAVCNKGISCGYASSYQPLKNQLLGMSCN